MSVFLKETKFLMLRNTRISFYCFGYQMHLSGRFFSFQEINFASLVAEKVSELREVKAQALSRNQI
jgi:hypothetical protein